MKLPSRHGFSTDNMMPGEILLADTLYEQCDAQFASAKPIHLLFEQLVARHRTFTKLFARHCTTKSSKSAASLASRQAGTCAT